MLGRFLGRAHTRLWDMKGNSQLHVKQTKLAELGADEVSIEVAGECHPQLSCARETSLHSGISDECGLAGGVCSHGFPLLGMFLAMPAPERFLTMTWRWRSCWWTRTCTSCTWTPAAATTATVSC